MAGTHGPLVAARTGRHASRGLRYALVVDELNRFAPRDGKDDITKLLERVAREMRSQGIILLGAQQMASLVSAEIVENASIRVLGRSGAGELRDRVWTSWDMTDRMRATVLGPAEKLVMQPSCSRPMLVKMPYPAWAMRREEIGAASLSEIPEI